MFDGLNFSIRETFPHNKACYGEIHHPLFHHLCSSQGLHLKIVKTKTTIVFQHRAIPVKVEILQKCDSNKITFLVPVPTLQLFSREHVFLKMPTNIA